MLAYEILDSKRVCDAIDSFAAIWRNKKATREEKEQAFQGVLDRLPYQTETIIHKGPIPVPPPDKPKSGVQLFDTAEDAGLPEGFDPFVQPPDPPPHVQMLLEAIGGRKPGPNGKLKFNISPDFNANRLADFLIEAGLPYVPAPNGEGVRIQGQGQGWIITLVDA